jgi:hypothetical protein
MLGVFNEDAYYEDGVGLVSELKPFSHYRKFVQEVAPHAGFSIYAQGNGKMEELDGEQVFVVEELVPHVMNSVDLVSYAGRGGHLAESLLQEAMNSTDPDPSARTEKKDKNTMPTFEEQALPALAKMVTFIEAQATQATKDAEVADADTRVAEAIKAAVEAAKKVAEAEVSDKAREKLYVSVSEGNFEVEDAIAEAVELRKEVEEELTAKLTESVEGSFASGKSDSWDFTVGSWK